MRRISGIAVALVLFTASLSAQHTQSSEHQPGTPSAHEKHWGYTDGPETVGPSGWGNLEGDGACATGSHQSPIDLPKGGAAQAPKDKDTPALAFDYHRSKLSVVNNGHTVQANLDPGSTVSIAGATYRLVQFHFHAPSEHTVKGEHYPLEIHLVHVDEAGNPALVVGIFVRAGGPNAALEVPLSKLPHHEGETVNLPSVSIDLANLLPQSRGFLHYEGSLTTPPCTEGIRWYVMDSPIQMSQEQIAAFTSVPHMDGSARPTQPLKGRTLEQGAGRAN